MSVTAGAGQAERSQDPENSFLTSAWVAGTQVLNTSPTASYDAHEQGAGSEAEELDLNPGIQDMHMSCSTFTSVPNAHFHTMILRKLVEDRLQINKKLNRKNRENSRESNTVNNQRGPPGSCLCNILLHIISDGITSPARHKLESTCYQ